MDIYFSSLLQILSFTSLSFSIILYLQFVEEDVEIVLRIVKENEEKKKKLQESEDKNCGYKNEETEEAFD